MLQMMLREAHLTEIAASYPGLLWSMNISSTWIVLLPFLQFSASDYSIRFQGPFGIELREVYHVMGQETEQKVKIARLVFWTDMERE